MNKMGNNLRTDFIFLVIVFCSFTSGQAARRLSNHCATVEIPKLNPSAKQQLQARFDSMKIDGVDEFSKDKMEGELSKASRIMDKLKAEGVEHAKINGVSPFNLSNLTTPQNRILFRAMHYYRFRAKQKFDDWKSKNPEEQNIPRAVLQQIQNDLSQADSLYDFIWKANYRLGAKFAGRFDVNNLDDNTQEASLAIREAVKSFTFTKGNAFSTYASTAVIRRLNRLEEERAELASKEKQVDDRKGHFGETKEAKVSEFGMLVQESELREEIEAAMKKLTPNQRKIMELRFGFNGNTETHTIVEIAAIMKLGRGTVANEINEALERLRKHLGAE